MKNDGGPAFPRPMSDEDKWGHTEPAQPGMPLRDYYKAAALFSGLCPVNSFNFTEIAEWCGDVADAMLAEGDKEEA